MTFHYFSQLPRIVFLTILLSFATVPVNAALYEISLTGTVDGITPGFAPSVEIGQAASWNFLIDDSVPNQDIDFSGSTVLSYTGGWRVYHPAIVSGIIRVGDSIVLPYTPDLFDSEVGATVQNDWTLYFSPVPGHSSPVDGPQDGLTFTGNNSADPMNPLLQIDGQSVFGFWAELVDPTQGSLSNTSLAEALLLGFGGYSEGNMRINFDMTGTEGIFIVLNSWELTPVPVPATVWLFGSAVLSMFGLRRRSGLSAVIN